MNRYRLFIFFIVLTPSIFGIKPTRVILATDNKPLYIQFWPLVASAWKHWIGLKPTLALIADDDVVVDETLGDVIRFKPIAGIPTSFYAQIVRLLMPTLYPDDVCILSDIDMLPLSKVFFLNCVEHIPDNHYVVYTDQAYKKKDMQYPICYQAAKGSVFRELTGVNNIKDFPAKIREWHQLKIGWVADEKILYGLLRHWSGYPNRLTLLGYKTGNQRIDRSNWSFDKDLLAAGYYIDAHMLRPYDRYRIPIQSLIDGVFKVGNR